MAGFGAFAIGCAVMTAWARACVHESVVANANASKYALFGGYLLLGLLFGAADAIAVAGEPGAPLLTSPRRSGSRSGLRTRCARQLRQVDRVYHKAPSSTGI
jgi:hypothetical protein